MTDFTLTRNPFGKLVLHDANGIAHEGVVPVRAFPIAAPQEGIALVDTDGHELAWITSLDTLPDATRTLIETELASREFMPCITRIRSVSSYVTPSQWEVDTDHGPARLTLKGEEDIRRLGGGRLLIADRHGVQFLIHALDQLDRGSRRILDRFL